MLDAIDKEILRFLEQDGRKPYAEIAKALKISNTMVHQRLAKMKQRGFIKGIKIELVETKMGYEWSGFTGLVLKEDSDSESIIAALKKIPEVLECYYITGQYTLYLRLVARNSEHMRSVLYEKIDHIPGVLKTESLINFGTAFKRGVPID
ncbi:MAG: Lrp/AsnC family transcriptional regulator for asnA, asnC and gidA [Algoriphagus sp.]|jgi:Lrp/AsnC family transcriptional regulator for asnA, asnC and gidA